MARPTNRLSARFVQTAKPGRHADGAGLYLLVSPEGTRSWVFRYRRGGKLRDMGLGSAADFTLADARERARAQRQLLADGLDPLEHRQAASARRERLWGEAYREYVADHRGEWKSTPAEPGAQGAQEQQWLNSLAAYGPPDATPVRNLTTDAALACLRPVWAAKTETATRVRGRCERVWDAEKVKGHVVGENPFRWRGHLAVLLPKPSKLARVRHHPAMPHADLPELMAELTDTPGRAALALRWTILTAARTGETLGFRRSEVTRSGPLGPLWTIPAERMKAGAPHEVPLTQAALDVLDAAEGDAPFALSENAMLYLLQRQRPKGLARPYTVHGFRSSFYDWNRDHGHAPEHVADAALAHTISDETKAAYGRSTLLALRRDLMQKWADYNTSADDLADRL